MNESRFLRYLIQNDDILVPVDVFSEKVSVYDYVLVRAASPALYFQRRLHFIIREQIVIDDRLQSCRASHRIGFYPQTADVFSYQIILK